MCYQCLILACVFYDGTPILLIVRLVALKTEEFCQIPFNRLSMMVCITCV